MKGVKEFFKIDYGDLDNDQIYLRKEDFLKYLLDNSIHYQELKKYIDKNTQISLNPETSLEEIRFRSLFDNYNNDINLIIISYVCRFNINLGEEFLKELAFITSNIFDFQYYNRKHINVFMDLIGIDKNKNAIVERLDYLQSNREALGLHDNFIKNIYKAITGDIRKNKSLLTERVNWIEIREREICSDNFFKKYYNLCNSYYLSN